MPNQNSDNYGSLLDFALGKQRTQDMPNPDMERLLKDPRLS